MEADKVAGEYTHQNLHVPRKDPKDIPVRKRNVKEKSNLAGEILLSQSSRYQHEVVVLNPNYWDIIIATLLVSKGTESCLGKVIVDILVVVPKLLLENSSLQH